MSKSKEFGPRLRERREEMDMSRAQLARQAGLSSHAIYLIERGERTRLRADTIVGLARAFRLTVSEFRQEFGLTIGAEPEDYTERFEQTVKDDPNLRPNEKKSLITVYKSYVERRR